MKKIFVFIVTGFIVGCTQKNQNTSSSSSNAVDSVKWLYYAYTYEDTALFFKDTKATGFVPVECAVKIDTSFQVSDSLKILVSFFREGFRYSHVYDGLDPYGFVYFNGVVKPLTKMTVIEGFNDWTYLQADNRRIDSAFRAYLRTTNRDRLSPWLLMEAKKRGVL